MNTVAILTLLVSAVHSQQPVPVASATAERTADIEKVADAIVPELLRTRNIPGAAVAIVWRGNVMFTKGYGVTDLEKRAPVTAATVFQLASTTKPFTAAVMMRLIEEGKMTLDSRLFDFLPWLPEQYRGITIGQLLTHTSGVRYDLRRENIDEFTREEFRRRLQASEAAFPPGTQWQYSNTGYTLLALVAEAVAGKPFGDLLQQQIFEPLRMTSAGYRVATPAENDAIGYDLVDGQLQRVPRVFSGWGNSGIQMNVSDLARWVASLSQKTLLSAESYAAMERPARLLNGSEVTFPFQGRQASYGLGWFLASVNGARLVTHGGAIAGFSSLVNRFDDLAIIVLANGKQGADRRGQADAIATSLFERLRPVLQ